MAYHHKNFAYSTVLTAPSPAASGTSLVVQSGDGTKFPQVPFNATVWPVGTQPLTTNAEIVTVTNVSTDTFTIVRSAEGTAARSIIVGDQIAATITSDLLIDIEGYYGFIEPRQATNTVALAPTAGSWYLAPFTVYGAMSGGRINVMIQNTSTANMFRDVTANYASSLTGAQQQGYTFSLAAALFSQGSGTNSTRLESLWSNTHTFGWTKSVSLSSSNVSQFNVSVGHSLSYIGEVGNDGAYTLSLYNNSKSSAVAASSLNSTWGDSIAASARNMLSGSLMIPVGLNTTITGGVYWMGLAWSTSRSNASTGTRIATALDFSHSGWIGLSRIVMDSVYRGWPATASTSISAIVPYGAATNAAAITPPANIVISNGLATIASAWVPYFNVNLRGTK